MSKRKEIFKDAGIYTVSSYIAQVFDVLNGVLMRRFLGPANMGIWAFLQVIQNYAKHSSLGVTTATARDIPYYREKGDPAKVDEVKNLVFTFTVLASLLTSAGIVLYAFWKRRSLSPEIFWGLCVVSAIIFIQRIYNLFITLLRAHKEFTLTGLLNILSSILSVLFTVVLTWKFQLYGFYAGLILNYIAIIAAVLLKTKYRFTFRFSWKELKPLLSLGIAVLVADILRSVLVSIDRLVITKYMGFEALGIYSVALMADNYLYSLPNMFGVIFFPHFQEAFAKKDSAHDLEKYLREPTIGLSYFFPMIIGLVWCFSIWFVPTFLPKYNEGITALKILSLGSLFFALTHSFTTFLVTVKKHWLLIPLNAAAVVFGLGINWVFIHMGKGIEWVAAAESIISFFYFFILSLVSFRSILTFKQTVGLYAKVFLLFVYFSGVLFGLDYLFAGMPNGFLKFLIEYSLFCIAMIPVLYFGEKETHVFETVIHMITGKFVSKHGG